MTFESYDLKDSLKKSIEELGFKTPTDIQQKAIPYLLKNSRDLIALAQTGTGKTASFGLPVLNKVDPQIKTVQAIILCPTRELCNQLADDLIAFSKHEKGIKITAVYGGADIVKQIKQLERGTQIVVGTPGRTLDLIKRKKLKLGSVGYVVFDEADEMLSMGFKDEMDQILESTPEQKQVLLFSATMPKEVARIASRYMNDPHEIAIGHKNTGNKNVEHQYYHVTSKTRYEVLKRIADMNSGFFSIVFCRTRAATNEVAQWLSRDGYNADALNGDLSQKQRDYVLDKFRNRQLQILVATDVAARGLDVSEITHVINFNLPDELATYVHRSGRTGRANNKGISIILASGRDMRRLKEVSKLIKLPISKMEVPSGKEVMHRRLITRVEKWKEMDLKTDFFDESLAKVNELLVDYSKEELIKKWIALEFNASLEHYEKMNELEIPDDKEGRGGRNGSRRFSFSRFYINLGKNHDINPPKLLGLINRYINKKGVEIGKIEISQAFSFFDIDEKHAELIPKSLNKRKYDDVTILVKPVASRRGSSDRGRSKRKFEKGYGSGKKRGGRRSGRNNKR